MIVDTILAQIASLAEARVQAFLLARAVSELPGITFALHPGGIRLSAHGLFQRAFGSRHRRRDPWLAHFTRRHK